MRNAVSVASKRNAIRLQCVEFSRFVESVTANNQTIADDSTRRQHLRFVGRFFDRNNNNY